MSLAVDSHISSFSNGGVMTLDDRWRTDGTSSAILVMIHVLAYMLTLRGEQVQRYNENMGLTGQCTCQEIWLPLFAR